MDIVHGGLTGWNIFIIEDGMVPLTNFGLMPILYRRIESSEILETYYDDCRWADPVLWFGLVDGRARPSETLATDVYALGRVLYQIMTDEDPFHGLWNDLGELRSLLESRTPATFRPSRPLKPLVVNDVWELSGGCWEVDHFKRPTMQVIMSKLLALPSLHAAPRTRYRSHQHIRTPY